MVSFHLKHFRCPKHDDEYWVPDSGIPHGAAVPIQIPELHSVDSGNIYIWNTIIGILKIYIYILILWYTKFMNILAYLSIKL